MGGRSLPWGKEPYRPPGIPPRMPPGGGVGKEAQAAPEANPLSIGKREYLPRSDERRGRTPRPGWRGREGRIPLPMGEAIPWEAIPQVVFLLPGGKSRPVWLTVPSPWILRRKGGRSSYAPLREEEGFRGRDKKRSPWAKTPKTPGCPSVSRTLLLFGKRKHCAPVPLLGEGWGPGAGVTLSPGHTSAGEIRCAEAVRRPLAEGARPRPTIAV